MIVIEKRIKRICVQKKSAHHYYQHLLHHYQLIVQQTTLAFPQNICVIFNFVCKLIVYIYRAKTNPNKVIFVIKNWQHKIIWNIVTVYIHTLQPAKKSAHTKCRAHNMTAWVNARCIQRHSSTTPKDFIHIKRAPMHRINIKQEKTRRAEVSSIIALAIQCKKNTRFKTAMIHKRIYEKKWNTHEFFTNDVNW